MVSVYDEKEYRMSQKKKSLNWFIKCNCTSGPPELEVSEFGSRSFDFHVFLCAQGKSEQDGRRDKNVLMLVLNELIQSEYQLLEF